MYTFSAHASGSVRARVLGASAQLRAIRERISEALIVILNGSRLLLADPKRKHFVGENGHFLSVDGPSKPRRSAP